MNLQFPWKEGQIDPSFDRPHEQEFTLAPIHRSHHVTPTSLEPVATLIKSTSPTQDSISSSESKSDAGQISASFHQESPAPAPRARRNLSSTKRAAQNRNAQKAFRQRKEKYFKELEASAAQVPELQKTIEDLRQENMHLRDYTMALQTRLIELNPNMVFPMVPHRSPPQQ